MLWLLVSLMVQPTFCNIEGSDEAKICTAKECLLKTESWSSSKLILLQSVDPQTTGFIETSYQEQFFSKLMFLTNKSNDRGAPAIDLIYETSTSFPHVVSSEIILFRLKHKNSQSTLDVINAGRQGYLVFFVDKNKCTSYSVSNENFHKSLRPKAFDGVDHNHEDHVSNYLFEADQNMLVVTGSRLVWNHLSFDESLKVCNRVKGNKNLLRQALLLLACQRSLKHLRGKINVGVSCQQKENPYLEEDIVVSIYSFAPYVETSIKTEKNPLQPLRTKLSPTNQQNKSSLEKIDPTNYVAESSSWNLPPRASGVSLTRSRNRSYDRPRFSFQRTLSNTNIKCSSNGITTQTITFPREFGPVLNQFSQQNPYEFQEFCWEKLYAEVLNQEAASRSVQNSDALSDSDYEVSYIMRKSSENLPSYNPSDSGPQRPRKKKKPNSPYKCFDEMPLSTRTHRTNSQVFHSSTAKHLLPEKHSFRSRATHQKIYDLN